MKVLFILLLLVDVSVPGFDSDAASAQRFATIPIDIEIPVPPTPVKANGQLHLLYELHLTNFSARNLEVTRVEVLKDSSNGPTLSSYADSELNERLARPGARSC